MLVARAPFFSAGQTKEFHVRDATEKRPNKRQNSSEMWKKEMLKSQMPNTPFRLLDIS